jgi:RNA polymerase sigma-70 factor (sigma-E family)
MSEPDGFREYAQARQVALLRTAYLCTGDHHLAQDLVQATLTRVWIRWDRVSRAENIDAYVNRVLFTVYAGWRRRFWHAEIPHHRMPETAVAEEQHTDRLAMLTALRQLPARQRAVVVLRFYQGLSEAQTADALGCTVGTVKSQSSKALAALRRIAPALLLAGDTARREPT